MNKPTKPTKFIKEQINILHGSCYGESLKSIIDSIPKNIPLDQVHLNTEIERGYYNDCTAILDVYYNDEVLNKNYEKQLIQYEKDLEKYNLIIEKEEYLKNNKDKHFEVGETIYLFKHNIFFGELELAQLKKITKVKITKVLPPRSRNNSQMNSENWMQEIYFYDDNGNEISSLLYSKDVICRNKEFLSV